MKILLIALNALLTLLLLFAIAGHFDEADTPVFPTANTAAQRAAANASPSEPRERLRTADAERAGYTADAIRSAIAANSLVGVTTDGGAAGPRRGGTTVSLVGTVTAGEHSAAIFLISAPRNRDFRDRNANTQTQKQPEDYSFKQYIRLGETNASGYKLIAVEPNRAVLTRAGERLELVMAAPSQNAPGASSADTRNNQSANARFTARDAIAMQMFQNMQMMRIMDRLVRQQQRTGSGSSLSGRRGGSSGGSSGGGFGGGGFPGGGMGGGGFPGSGGR